MTATIAVLNQKGGVGKTTLATNLAAAAHLAGIRTLLIDLDLQGSALDWYHARQEGSSLDGLGVVKVDRALALPKFKTISTGYKMVLIDGPPRLDTLTRSAAVTADVVLVPVRPGAYDLWALEETLSTLADADQVRRELGLEPAAKVFVITQATPTRITREAPDALRDIGELADAIVGMRVAFPEAANLGESVLTIAPGSAAADEITALYQYLWNRHLKGAKRWSKRAKPST